MSEPDRYRISDIIFESGETTFYRGSWDADSAPATIKLLRSDRPDPRGLTRLRHEYSILRELRIPGIPIPYALERHRTLGLALILQPIEGLPLSVVRGQAGLGLLRSLQIGAALAKTLAELHRHRILHQGVHPGSIFYDSASQCVTLVDFGAASPLGAEGGGTIHLTDLGSALAYISPEQTGRINRVVDTRSDLYSLGATLYELLTGTVPFHSTDPMQVVHGHIARNPVPPRQVEASIPAIVSELVLKLLAKSPEDRYQTAIGVHADLAECARQLAANGSIQPFPLRRKDRDGRLRTAQRLYGRDAELSVLMSAFERVSAGATELLLVSGYSGVGKSALVHEINRPIASRGGHFIAGKFDQLNRNIPYDSIIQAFRELIRLLLSESEASLAGWKTRLQAAIQPNGKLITDLVPELALILGEQPAVLPLPPAEAQSRFNRVLQSFVRAMATAEHPLVLFTDDLQWIDSASLKLLQSLSSDPECTHLLIIGAYRDNEVDSAHLLALAIDVLRKSQARLNEIRLQPLSRDSITELLAEMLGQPETEVAPLAAVVFAKADGNPFFTNQFVASLYTDRLLWFEEGSGAWKWDLASIQQRMATDNVVSFLLSRLRLLGSQTQRALQFAAACGHRFDLKTLSVITGQSLAEIATHLWPALKDGLLWPLQADYRFLSPGEGQFTELLASADFTVAFKFQHDRVQQAAYALIPEDQRQHIHLRIGRLIRDSLAGGVKEQSESLFSVAKHLNIAVSQITEEPERLALARLNLLAGRRAKAASASEAARAYLTTGVSLLTELHWAQHYELAFGLNLELAECESLLGHFEPAEALFEMLSGRASSDIEFAQVSLLRLSAYGMQGRYPAMLACGYKALARLGMPIPTTPEERNAALAAELAAISAGLGERRIADLIDAPEVSDPTVAIALKLLNILAPVTFIVSAEDYGVMLLKQVNLSVRYGHTEISSFGYISYAFMLVGMLRQYQQAYEYGRLALALNEKYNNTNIACRLNSGFAIFLHFSRPLREAIDYYERAYHFGLDTSDFFYTPFACFSIILAKLSLGEPLSLLGQEVERFEKALSNFKEIAATSQLSLCRQTIAALQGGTRGRTSLSDKNFDEDEFRQQQEQLAVQPNLGRYYFTKLQLCYLYGDYAGALAAESEIAKVAPNISGLYESTLCPYYTCLTLLALSRAAPPEQRGQYAEKIAACTAELTGFAEQCPDNYGQKLAILRAEAAALQGSSEADSLYDQAIEAAGRGEFLRDAALANELAGRHHHALGRMTQAGRYIKAARQDYLRWGASVKVTQLEEQYPQLLGREPQPVQEQYISESAPEAPGAPQLQGGISLDLRTVLQVAKSISSEIVLEKVLVHTLQAVVDNSGAQRGFIILELKGQLYIEAMLVPGEAAVQVKLGMPIETSTELATTVVQYVARTRETVVLGDASHKSRFLSDRYVAQQQPKSIMCLALIHQGRLVGILYLENNLATNVFTESSVELLRMLSSHAAVSVENASLYAEVKSIGEELSSLNSELTSANLRLQHELKERTRAEQERAQAERERALLQAEIIQTQNARLAELSTPLIPIHDQIVVMPIIGTMDEHRAQQVLDTALNGAQSLRAKTVIIDITGLKHVDTSVANTLIQTAKALQLLGTQAILTGIRAEVAQTLVSLGVDLGNIVTLSTLQTGIVYALARTGQSVGRNSTRR